MNKRKRLLFIYLGLLISLPHFGQVNTTFTVDSSSINSFNLKFTSTYNLPDTLNYNFYWDFGDFTSSNLPVTSHMYEKAGKYLVQFTVSDNSISETSSELIIVKDIFQIPNVFTPNGDGINDMWVLRTNGKDIYKVSIFSPSGSRVFEQSSYTISWDGKTPSGNEVHSGVYYYVITRQGRYIDTGFFHLIR